MPFTPEASSSQPKKKALPSNAKSVIQFSLDELKKTAASRGIPIETLIAQMVQQYLAEDKLKK
jgi:predicted DNA binding CopG/RHH family protein